MFDRVLVAFDGSPESRRASRVALEVAARFHSSVTVACVHPPGRGDGDSALSRLVPVDAEGRTLPMLIEELQGEGKAKGIASIEPVYLSGEVTESILDYLQAHPHDLAIVGSRGLSRGRRLFLGSVSAGLVNDAPCPVLVVRPTRGARAGDPGRARSSGGTPGPTSPAAGTAAGASGTRNPPAR
jgi:nucleotide-binding universal stress UspA family protein